MAAPLSSPTRRLRLVAALFIGAIALTACADDDEVATLTNDPIPAESIQSDAAVGSEVDVAFTTFDGQPANLTRYAGTPVVVNFFARTCPACVSEMPEFEEVFQAFGGEVAFLGASTDPRIEDAQVLIDQTGVTYDLAWDPDAELFAYFGGFAMPTTVFIDATGVVRETWSGVLTAEDLTAKIEEIQ